MVLTISLKVLGKGVPDRGKGRQDKQSAGSRREKRRMVVTELEREDVFVVELRFDPAHQQIDVFGSGNLDRLLHFDAVSPQIFVPGQSEEAEGVRRPQKKKKKGKEGKGSVRRTSRHHRASGGGAELTDGTVKKRNFIEKIDS
jgi:hypothetical protein